MINTVVLEGRLTVDPVLKTTLNEGRDGVKRVAMEIMAREVGMPPAAGARQTADSDFEEVGAE